MITFHPTFSRTTDGFIPMVTMRGTGGRMLGSWTPKGVARDFRTFTTEAHAISEAMCISLRAQLSRPETVRTA